VVQRLEHDKEILALVLQLGALIGVQDVLYDQRMQSKPLTELAQCFGLVQAIHVDPRHTRLVTWGKTLLPGIHEAVTA
jgi:hypothetical protein